MVRSIISQCLLNTGEIQREDVMTIFKSGVSGNPAGRPKGSLNKKTQLIKLMEAHAEALISKTIDLALAGDTVALRLCIERLIPKINDRPTTVVMPNLEEMETTKIVPELLRSLAGQEISLSEFKSLMDVFMLHDDAIHTKEKQETLRITTTDPIEAAKQYQQIMMTSHS